MDGFYLPFGAGPKAGNRRVRTAQIIPWDLEEAFYAKSFSMEKGRAAIASRIASGVMYIKEQENLTDEGTVMYLSENPYAPYFVGLKEFRTEPLFEASRVCEAGEEHLTRAERERLETIPKVHEQRRTMRGTGARSIPGRIARLRQPHARCIMRGKAGSPYGFGRKTRLSMVKGFPFVEEQSYDSFNEGTGLKEAAERYRKRMGHWPKAILADTICRNRENRMFCKEHGIRLSGPRLGGPRKGEAEAGKAQAYQDSLERSAMESRHGIAKRRYGLDRIMAYLAETGLTEAALQIVVMNAAHLPRFFLRNFSCAWKRPHRAFGWPSAMGLAA